MGKTRGSILVAFVLITSFVGATTLGLEAVAQDKPGAADGALTTRIDKRVQAWQPTRDERRLDDIGWAQDIRDALRLAREHRRPIFLFTYSGSTERDHAMALQRC